MIFCSEPFKLLDSFILKEVMLFHISVDSFVRSNSDRVLTFPGPHWLLLKIKETVYNKEEENFSSPKKRPQKDQERN